MKILFIGDVVGPLGQSMVEEYLPELKQKYKPQVTIINGENAANGRGITESIYKKFLQDGADVVTLGNHAWDNREIFDFIEDADKLVRPANFPEATTPGRGMVFINVNQYKLAVINLQGTALMDSLQDPFLKADELVAEAREETDLIFMDFHAETTSEKQAMGWHLDGRVSAVIGTHTHVQTSDARILPQGTAYLTDVGMTGPYDGILGMRREDILRRYYTHMPTRFNVEEKGRRLLSGCIITVDEDSGSATKIERILINEDNTFYN